MPRAVVALGLVALALGAVALTAEAMRTTKVDRLLCETTGGGRFVDLKAFPGEMIDRRLRRDVRYLRKRFQIFVTDGYSLDRVHSRNGEHPIGLALDIVPDFANGGSWRRISRLAKWAEPKQDRPRAPFRWVGYNGDPGHGRGHHLHLSYSHSPTKYNKPARTIYSLKCPGARKRNGSKSGGDGGTTAGGSGGGSSSGGIGFSRAERKRLARAHPETGGIGLP